MESADERPTLERSAPVARQAYSHQSARTRMIECVLSGLQQRTAMTNSAQFPVHPSGACMRLCAHSIRSVRHAADSLSRTLWRSDPMRCDAAEVRPKRCVCHCAHAFGVLYQCCTHACTLHGHCVRSNYTHHRRQRRCGAAEFDKNVFIKVMMLTYCP